MEILWLGFGGIACYSHVGSHESCLKVILKHNHDSAIIFLPHKDFKF